MSELLRMDTFRVIWRGLPVLEPRLLLGAPPALVSCLKDSSLHEYGKRTKNLRKVVMEIIFQIILVFSDKATAMHLLTKKLL